MKSYLDCIPCFFKQALETARIADADIQTQHQILNEVSKIIPTFQLETSPPEMARIIHGLVQKYTKVADPYLKIKDESNQFALAIYEKLIHKLDESSTRLLMAVELAIAGNIIDYGVKNSLNVDEELEKILNGEQETIQNEAAHFFQYSAFATSLIKAKNILYLADNAGELVFDRILLEEILRIDPQKEIIFAVKEKPIINDALKKDAVDCGIDKIPTIISSGSDAPGTLLPRCSDKFIYDKQGRFIECI